jgi:hypothetical protein
MALRRGGIVAVLAVCATIGLAGQNVAGATALNHVPPARAPCSVLGGHPCHPSFCGVFHHGPCFPAYPVPFGESLRLTVLSTVANDPGAKSTAGADGQAAAGHELNSIRQIFATLRGCWVPPPKNEAWHGMEYTVRFSLKRDGEMIAPPRVTYVSHDAPPAARDVYRDAVDAALKRCMPLHLSESLGEAVAGRPIAFRFVDDRAIDKDFGK